MALLTFCARRAVSIPRGIQARTVSTLKENPHIYAFPRQQPVGGYTLSLLPTDPPAQELSIGTTSKLPPVPDSFSENLNFLKTVDSVIAEHAHKDPDVISQAQVMASTSGSNLGSGGVFFMAEGKKKKRPGYGGGGGAGGDSSGGASGQGGVGSGGRGGWIHVSDARNAPEYGRIAWPEDIFGSLEVDGSGNLVNGKGRYQSSGTYRIVTRNGILGLSPFLREKLVQRLREEETKLRK